MMEVCDNCSCFKIMYSYSYNGEKSISRLDELLNRNEIIYQNLKLKLDEINKSSQNIHRNIHTIHEHEQETNPLASTLPHLEDSSAVQQETQLRSPLSLQDQNLSSIQKSKALSESQMESSRKKMSQREEYTLNFYNSRKDDLEDEVMQGGEKIGKEKEERRVMMEQEKQIEHLNFELSRSKLSQQGLSFQQDRTAYLEIENNMSPRASQSPSLRTLKGNAVYLQALPKTEMHPSEASFNEMLTFRDSMGREEDLRVKEEERVIKQEWMEDLAQQEKQEKYVQRDMSFQFEASKQRGSNQPRDHRAHLVGSEIFNYTPTDNLSNSNRFEASRNKTDSFRLDCWGVSPEKSSSPLYKEIQKDKVWEQRPSECYFFAPFNKVYRSPILQIKSQGTVLLQRKSKTALGQHNTSDPIKFRLKHTITDEQILLKILLTGQDSLDFSRIRDSRVAILEGKATLKKKLHLALLAYLFQAAAHRLTSGNVQVKVQHQESGHPQPLQTVIEGRRGTERVSLLQLERIGEDVSRIVLENKKEEVLRATRVRVEGQGGQGGWQFSIVSSNRVECEFVRCLGADRICWSVNPLVRNYDDVLHTLQVLTRFQQQKPNR